MLNEAGAASVLRIIAAGALALGLSGCSMDMFGSGGGADNTQAANANATPAQIAQGAANALPAIATECPPIKVRPGAEAVFNYGSSRVAAPEALHYQIEFERETRNCVVSNGLITVKMGVAGRVLLGPAGNETQVTAPLRFEVDRNGTPVFSEKYPIPVTITPPAQSQEFLKEVDNVAIPYLGGEDIVIWVGFDGGKTPPPAAAASSPN